MYDQFVENFGTHYFEMGIFGGYLYQKTFIEDSYMMSSDEHEVTANLEASFGGMVKATAEAEESRKKVSESFKKNSQTQFFFYGGTPVTISQDDPSGFMEQWVPTVNRDPWLFAGKVKPIENLIANDFARGELQKAISLKRARAYLAEIKYAVSIGRIPLDAQARAELNQIDQMLNTSGSKDIGSVVRNLDKINDMITSFRSKFELFCSLKRTILSHIPCYYTLRPFSSQAIVR